MAMLGEVSGSDTERATDFPRMHTSVIVKLSSVNFRGLLYKMYTQRLGVRTLLLCV